MNCRKIQFCFWCGGEELCPLCPGTVLHFSHRPWAWSQPWSGSANDCRTKAKCRAVKLDEAGRTPLTLSLSRVQNVEPVSNYYQQLLCSLFSGTNSFLRDISPTFLQNFHTFSHFHEHLKLMPFKMICWISERLALCEALK